MEKDTKRALRRHHMARIKRARSHYNGIRNWDGITDHQFSHAVGRLAHTATLCSCFGCGNPRRHGNQQTQQELSSTESFRLIEQSDDQSE